MVRMSILITKEAEGEGRSQDGMVGKDKEKVGVKGKG